MGSTLDNYSNCYNFIICLFKRKFTLSRITPQKLYHIDVTYVKVYT